MARLFDDAASDHLLVTSTPVTAVPYSIAGWFRRDATTNGTILTISNNGVNNNYLRMGVLSSGNKFFSDINNNGAGTLISITSPATSLGTWHHGVATWTTTEANIYLDGGNNVNDTVSGTITGLNTVAIGVLQRDNQIQFFSGDLGELAIYNIALTAVDAAILAAGFSPLFVKPANLVFYAPIYGRSSPEIDLMGHRNLTVSGTVFADHPAIIDMPTSQIVGFSPAPVIKIPPCGPLHSGLVDPRRLSGLLDPARESGMVDPNRLTGLTCV